MLNVLWWKYSRKFKLTISEIHKNEIISAIIGFILLAGLATFAVGTFIGFLILNWYYLTICVSGFVVDIFLMWLYIEIFQ